MFLVNKAGGYHNSTGYSPEYSWFYFLQENIFSFVRTYNKRIMESV